jgi:hypothetical protein
MGMLSLLLLYCFICSQCYHPSFLLFLNIITLLFFFFFYVSGYCEAQFDSFASLCANIAGDSPMYSLFRRHADPVKCPFKGPFTFAYSKGGTGSVCAYPKSYMDSCEDGHRLQLHFQAGLAIKNPQKTQKTHLKLKLTKKVCFWFLNFFIFYENNTNFSL